MREIVKTRFGREIVLPTPEEDARITAAAMADPDARPMTDADWEAVRPTAHIERPKAKETKEHITVRHSPERNRRAGQA
jgi:hypothetical protein